MCVRIKIASTGIGGTWHPQIFLAFELASQFKRLIKIRTKEGPDPGRISVTLFCSYISVFISMKNFPYEVGNLRSCDAHIVITKDEHRSSYYNTKCSWVRFLASAYNMYIAPPPLLLPFSNKSVKLRLTWVSISPHRVTVYCRRLVQPTATLNPARRKIEKSGASG